MVRKSLLSSLFVSALALSACMSAPTGLDVSLKHPTAQMHYLAEIKPLQEPIALNTLHAWELRVTQQSGRPVTGATIAVSGGMPQHHHGFPTQPRVTKELGDGRYLIEGMKFSMSGWWEIKLKIDGAQGSDNATFNVVLPNKV
jgi:uncharacterized GH25 family protein